MPSTASTWSAWAVLERLEAIPALQLVRYYSTPVWDNSGCRLPRGMGAGVHTYRPFAPAPETASGGVRGSFPSGRPISRTAESILACCPPTPNASQLGAELEDPAPQKRENPLRATVLPVPYRGAKVGRRQHSASRGGVEYSGERTAPDPSGSTTAANLS